MRDDRMAGAQFPGEVNGAGDIDAGGAAEQQAFLFGEIEDDRQRFLVGDLVGEIDRRIDEIGGDRGPGRCPR